MIRSILFIAVFVLLYGCAGSDPKPKLTTEEIKTKDLYLMMVSDAENRDDFNLTANYYEKLFDLTKEKNYKNLQIESLLKARAFDAAIAVCDEELKQKEIREFRRYKTIAFTGKKEFVTALENAKKLTQNGSYAEDYELIGDLYYLLSNFNSAVANYKKSYAVEPNEIRVDKISAILHEKLDNTKEALAYYETHIIIYGCSEFLCQRVANIYAQNNNINGVISAYKKIYSFRNDKIIGQKIVELYILQKNYKKLAIWLESSGYNDLILLEIYRYEKDLIKAAKVALKLYEEKGDIEHLALHAMLGYEAGDSGDKSLILQTVKLLDRVVAQSENPVHLNYLGYLLIDHAVDVDRGVLLVQKALKQDPKNPYYTDSLAWGYHMQGKNEEAFRLINIAKEQLGDDKTLNEHYEAILKALKGE